MTNLKGHEVSQGDDTCSSKQAGLQYLFVSFERHALKCKREDYDAQEDTWATHKMHLHRARANLKFAWNYKRP